jgi:competence protein ComEC
MLAAIGLLGYIRTHQVASIPSTDISRLAGSRVTLAGLVTSVSRRSTPLKSRFHTISATLEVSRVGQGSDRPRKPVSGQVHATLGATDKLPHAGDTLEVTGDLERPSGLRNPGGVDYAALLARRGIFSVISAPVPQEWHIIHGPDNLAAALRAAIASVRNAIERTADSALPANDSAVLKGILLGDNEDIPDDLKDDFEQTGTVHILATAGLHVGIASMAIYGLLNRLGIGYRRAALITAVVLAIFALLAGGRASVTRAVTVADIWLLARVLGREPNAWTALSCAALLQLVWNPLMLYDAGFQMSFATVATIIVTMPLAAGGFDALHHKVGSESRLKKGGLWTAEKLTEIAVLTVCAQIGAAPLTACYFHTVSLSSVPANVTVIPAVILIMCIALAGAAVSLLYAPLGGLVFKLAIPALKWVSLSVHGWAQIPFAAWSVKTPPLYIVLLYYGAVWAAALAWRANSLQSSPEAGVK